MIVDSWLRCVFYTPLSSVVQSTELPSLSTDRHLVYPLKASFALSRGELYAARIVPTSERPYNTRSYIYCTQMR